MAFESAEIFERVLHMQAEGERGVLVTVVRADGSTPRKVGTRMLVFEDGQIFGTIGGGQVEQAVKDEATRVLVAGTPTVAAVQAYPGAGNVLRWPDDVFARTRGSTPEAYCVGLWPRGTGDS